MSLTSTTTMATHVNGANGVPTQTSQRFAEIPPAIDIPVYEGADEEAVEVNLTDLLDDPTELCTLLENENVAKSYWMVIALAYAKQNQVDHAIEILNKALSAFSRGKSADERLSILSALCWMYLWKCRDAPRIKPGKDALAVPRDLEILITFCRNRDGPRQSQQRILHQRRYHDP
jgi:RNA polymerase-associated protein CTR9